MASPPARFETAMAKGGHTPEIRADLTTPIPLNRYGLEEELAEAVFSFAATAPATSTGKFSRRRRASTPGAGHSGLPTLRGARRNS